MRRKRRRDRPYLSTTRAKHTFGHPIPAVSGRGAGEACELDPLAPLLGSVSQNPGLFMLHFPSTGHLLCAGPSQRELIQGLKGNHLHQKNREGLPQTRGEGLLNKHSLSKSLSRSLLKATWVR